MVKYLNSGSSISYAIDKSSVAFWEASSALRLTRNDSRHQSTYLLLFTLYANISGIIPRNRHKLLNNRCMLRCRSGKNSVAVTNSATASSPNLPEKLSWAACGIVDIEIKNLLSGDTFIISPASGLPVS